MNPATAPRDSRDDTRLLVLDPRSHRLQDARITALPDFMRAGDLLIVNDAATLPGSLRAQTESGETIELRLAGPADGGRFWAVLFGAGDHHMRTEDRAPPPELTRGDALLVGGRLHARVLALSPVSRRLIAVHFECDETSLWAELYALGTPVQYSYQADVLPLWSVQTAFAARPWAAEMPSAGRPLSFATLRALQRRGVRIASLTHAAGLSSTGDPELDAALPLPERYEIPASTVSAIETTRAAGGRVLAVGTTVVRALEGAAAASDGTLRAGSAYTELRLAPTSVLRVVTGILSGMHAPGESHYALLRAFAPEMQLRAAFEHAEREDYLAHEFGDATLILDGALESMRSAA